MMQYYNLLSIVNLIVKLIEVCLWAITVELVETGRLEFMVNVYA